MPTEKRYPSQLTFRTALALVLIGILLLSGTIAVAAQKALPIASLYPVKLWTENAQLSLTRSPQARTALLLKLSENRTDEIIALAEQGVTPPVKVIDLLEQQIQQILIIAGSMNGDAYTRTLLQLREFLLTQQRGISEHE